MNAVVQPAPADGAAIEALLNYTRNTGVRPVNYTFDPPPGVPRSSGEVDARAVPIHDARTEGGLALDICGFELVPHITSSGGWSKFLQRERVEQIYYAEMRALLKRHTRADKVVIFDHTLRDSGATPGQAALREPVRRVHDDQTLDSAPRRARRHLPPQEAAWRLERRFAIVNVWRPIGDPVLQAPLAICDSRTIALSDLLPSDLVYPDWTGETYAVAFNPQHRWYWYPRQTPSEVLLLKIFDSAMDGRARLTAHTAFDDPATSPPNAPPRRSIEVRALLFW